MYFLCIRRVTVPKPIEVEPSGNSVPPSIYESLIVVGFILAKRRNLQVIETKPAYKMYRLCANT